MKKLYISIPSVYQNMLTIFLKAYGKGQLYRRFNHDIVILGCVADYIYNVSKTKIDDSSQTDNNV